MSRLLVVEDEFDLLETLKGVLESKGHMVVGCGDGRDALEVLEAEDFDLVLLDVMLPGLSGLKVLERIRDRDATRELPVILISPSNPPLREEDLRQVTFLRKPFTLQSLLATVASKLEARSSAG